MDSENSFMALIYFIAFILLILCYYRIMRCFSKPKTSNYFNEIQLDDRYLSMINSDQQRCLLPLNVLNSLEYENIYNPLHEQPRQQYYAAPTSRISISTTRATMLPFCPSFNSIDLHSSNVGSFSRSPFNGPPPSYEECMMSSRTTSHNTNLPVN